MTPDENTAGELIPGEGKELSLTRRSTSIAARGLEQSRELLAGKLLTREIAERYLEDEDSVDLEEFTAIEDAAAESLSKQERGGLALYGLTSLSDVAAESLSKHEGWLGLAVLMSLSDSAAESLSKHDAVLFLKLDALPESAAEILRQHPSFRDD